MNTVDFIDLLDRRRLVTANIARQLRAKAAQGDQRITPKSILKYLVKKEIVSRAQAKELLETTLVVTDKAESSILGLTPLDDLPEPKQVKPAAMPPAPAAPSRSKRDAPAPGPEPVDDSPVLLQPIGGAADFAFGQGGALDPFLAEAAEADPLGAKSSKSFGTGKGPKGKKKKKKRSAADRGKSEWDSPLLLLGGTGLAVLLVAGVVLYWLLTRENADLLLKEANEAFEGGLYTQAIPKYEKFVLDYPSHQDHSQAKVRMGMAELWRDTEGTSDYARALATAQRVINEIEDEPAFAADDDDDRDGEGLSQAKRELSSLLTTIATGLAEQAEASDDPAIIAERVEQINTALSLTANTKYVPQRFRMNTELDAVRETLERVKLRQQRDTDLAAGLKAMDEAIAQGDTAAAFAARKALIKQYPVLLDNAALGEKVLKIAEAERSLVKFVESRQAAAVQPAPSAIVAELALAERSGGQAAATGSVAIQVDGALYGLNLADGALLWRRFVGMDGAALPVVLPNGNVVGVDSQQNELVCLEAESGKLAWRLPLEGKLATPGLSGERLLVPSEAGKLYVVEHATGELVGHVTFNQGLRLTPAVSERGDRIYVLGEHSNLYTLSAADFSCLGVYYLGHAAGAVAAPPVVTLNKIIVANNSGAETCRIHALGIGSDGAVDRESASHRLNGLVLTPLQTAGRRVAAVTSLGQAAVFEVGGDDKSALTVLAAREAQGREQLAYFGLLHEGHFWIAGRQLIKLAIQPTGNQLPVQSIEEDYRGDAFDYPLQAAGDLLIHVRRPARGPGAIAAASNAAGKPMWASHLAVPTAGAPAVDVSGLRITVGAASGAIHLLDREAMTRRVHDQPERLSGPAGAMPILTSSLPLDQGRMVLGGVGASRLLHYRPGNPRQSVKAVELAGPLSCELVGWRDGFVSATNVGQVTLHNAEDARPVATPFQPQLTPGRDYHWLRPAVADVEGDSELIISDGREKLYRVTMNSQPQPHLEAAASQDVGPSPLITPLAVVGARVFAGNEAGQLASFTLPELAPNEPIDVGGRAVWGPYAAGDGVLMAVDAGDLLMVAEDGAVRWRQPLKRGELGGVPLIDGDDLFVLHPAAGVARINLRDGTEVAFAELGQPAVTGPVAFGPRLVLSGADGTLLVVNRP